VDGDYFLLAREEFFKGEKLALRWRSPRIIVKALSDYVFQVEDLRNEQTEEAHRSRLKFYRDSELDAKVIIPHVLSSEKGMPVARLMKLTEEPDGLNVVVR